MMAHRARTMSFGEVVSKRRKQLGFNQTELAKEAKLSRNYISMIEQRSSDQLNLSVRSLIRLERALRIPSGMLFKLCAEERI